MRELNVNDYVERLKDIFPDIAEQSIKDVIKLGNTSITKELKQVAPTVMCVSKSIVDGTTNTFIMYNQLPAEVNNKYKNYSEKRKQNAEQRNRNK